MASRRSKDQAPDRGIYYRLLRYSSQFWVAFIIGLVGNALYSGVDASLTYLLKPLLNQGFVNRNQTFIEWLPVLVIVIFVVRASTNFVGSYAMNYVARSVVLYFRRDIFDKLLKVPASYYDNTSSGDILSKLIYNVEQVAKVGANSLTKLVQSFFLVVGLLIVMFITSWRLSLIFLISIPVIAVVAKLTSYYVRYISRRLQQGMGWLTSIAEETVESYRVVRTYGGQDYERDKFMRVLKDNRRRELNNVIVKNLSVSLTQLAAAGSLCVIIFLAASHPKTVLSAGGFVTLIASMLAILKPLKTFSTVNATIQRGVAAAQSLFEVLDYPEEPDTGTIDVDRVRGDLAFNQVSFTYPGAHERVLHDISFDVKAGQTVAIVGASGSGKSTLVSLIPRFYEPETGSIELDGYPLTAYRLTALRRQMALVSQNVRLFNDTVARNICYGIEPSQVSEQAIKQAAQAAYAWEFIQNLSDGLETMIGENGVLLSGGQRQRLAIARAILNNAPLLILDEATSALDTESEQHIQQALTHLMGGRTTIVIAHRLSTIENADKIVVIDGGRVVEVGDHHSLMHAQGYYSRLHALQFARKS